MREQDRGECEVRASMAGVEEAEAKNKRGIKSCSRSNNIEAMEAGRGKGKGRRRRRMPEQVRASTSPKRGRMVKMGVRFGTDRKRLNPRRVRCNTDAVNVNQDIHTQRADIDD